MTVDYHMHLEEGPYSFRWLQRTSEALIAFHDNPELIHSKDWLHLSTEHVLARLKKGAFQKEWLDLYLQRALEIGLKEVGIVDHLYRFRETLPYYKQFIELGNNRLGRLQRLWLEQVSCEQMDDFTALIQEEKGKWRAHGVELRLGLEADYFQSGETQLQSFIDKGEWDFVIGSVHFLNGWGFDNPKTKYLFDSQPVEHLYDAFFEEVEAAISSKLFDFVSHLDNFKCFGVHPPVAKKLGYYHTIAKALADNDVATEINSGLLYRFPVKEVCPSSEFLDILVKYGVPITTSSDAHFPDDVGKNIVQATKMLTDRGVTHVATFHQRNRIMKKIE